MKFDFTAFKAYVGAVLATSALSISETYVNLQNSLLKMWFYIDAVPPDVWLSEKHLLAFTLGYLAIYWSTNKGEEATP